MEDSVAAVDEEDGRLQQHLVASADVLRIYTALRKNMDDANAHCVERFSDQERELGLIGDKIEAHVGELRNSADTSNEKSENLEGDLQQSHQSIQVQLRHMDEKRVNIDNHIEGLENRERELSQQLDQVT